MLRLAGERLLQNLSAKLFSALPQDSSQRVWFLLLSFVLKLVLECCIL